MENRHRDILDLLSDALDIIIQLELEIDTADYDKTKYELTKPKIKSVLEHLRSCLDYCASDIYETVLMPKNIKRPSKIYFPYGKIVPDFYSSVCRFLPQLREVRNDIYLHLESVQPYKLHDNWLLIFFKFSNEHKHDRPKKQTRTNNLVISSNGLNAVSVGKGSTVVMNECTIEGNPTGLLIANNSHVSSDIDLEKAGIQTKIKPVFIFTETEINVIDLLVKSYEKISDFIEKLYLLMF